jgi:hypothetical protein
MTVLRELSRYVRFSGSAGGQMGGQWRRTNRRIHIIVLNVHARTEDNILGLKDSFYEELECVFDKFLK